MYLNIFPFIHFTVFVIYVFLAIYILQKNSKALLNKFFFVLLSCLAVWNFGLIFVHNLDTTKETATFFMKISSIGWIWLTVLMLWFAFIQTRTKIKTWVIVIFTILPSMFFTIMQWFNLLIVDYKYVYFGWSLVFSDTWIFYAWVFYYLFLVIALIAILLNRISKEKTGIYKTQTIIILIFLTITLIIGLLVDILLPFLDIRVVPDVASVIALGGLFGVGYAVIKYKFFIITPITASENILFTMSDMLIMLDYKGDIMNVNRATEKLLECKNKNVKKKSAKIFFKNFNEFNEVIDKSHTGERIIDKKTYFKTENNKKEILVIFTSVIMKDKNDNLIGIICTARDVGNIKEKEEKLKEQADKLENKIKQFKEFEIKLVNLLEDLNNEKENTDLERKKTKLIISNLTDPIIFINNENKIDLINPAAQVIFKLKDNIIGSTVSDENNYSLENFKKMINTDFEYRNHNKSNIKFEEIKIKHFDQDRIFKVLTVEVKNELDFKLGVLKVFYDFTRERSLENIKSEFISIASHKLRTPLSAIKWVIKMALDGDVGKLNTEQFDLLDKVYKSNERIIGLVNNLLNVSRIEEGRFGYNFKKISFKEPLDVINDYAQTLAEKNKIKFSINYNGELPIVNIDQDRIILVLQNLVDNAMKYTPSSGKIEVNIKNTKTWFTVGVKDNGVGIPIDDQKKLFTKFFRAKNVVRMQTEGSGLGLFIVKNIIEKHSGKMNIKSKEGIGTEISFSLPISNN
jgi:PAS domain S-box-containing protein